MKTGTRIITDCWRGYKRLSEMGYIHKTINHSVAFVSSEDNEIHTNTIERLWRDMRANIPSGLTSKHLENHIKAYMVIKNFNVQNSLLRFSFLISLLKHE